MIQTKHQAIKSTTLKVLQNIFQASNNIKSLQQQILSISEYISSGTENESSSSMNRYHFTVTGNKLEIENKIERCGYYF